MRLKGVSCDPSCNFDKRPLVKIENLRGDIRDSDRIRIGKNTTICSDYKENSLLASSRSKLVVSFEGRIEIGANSLIMCSVINSRCLVRIGDNCKIAPNTLIYDNDGHGIRAETRRLDDAVKAEPIVIDDDVWVGTQCIILKGVRIGKGSTIGAGSIVTHDIPAGVVAAGVPAEVVRRITANE
jgi:acetyltransferase-like isoleucine patch superfamily enzyme